MSHISLKCLKEFISILHHFHTSVKRPLTWRLAPLTTSLSRAGNINVWEFFLFISALNLHAYPPRSVSIPINYRQSFWVTLCYMNICLRVSDCPIFFVRPKFFFKKVATSLQLQINDNTDMYAQNKQAPKLPNSIMSLYQYSAGAFIILRCYTLTYQLIYKTIKIDMLRSNNIPLDWIVKVILLQIKGRIQHIINQNITHIDDINKE